MQERETTRKNRQEHGERNAKENMGRLNVSVKCMRISSEKQHEKERQRSPENSPKNVNTKRKQTIKEPRKERRQVKSYLSFLPLFIDCRLILVSP